MAVYSMTGYASAIEACRAPTLKVPLRRLRVTVELRSLNGRFLDLSLRLPDELRGLEPALRERIGAVFRRGKIELRMTTQRDGRRALAAAAQRATDAAGPSRKHGAGLAAERAAR